MQTGDVLVRAAVSGRPGSRLGRRNRTSRHSTATPTPTALPGRLGLGKRIQNIFKNRVNAFNWRPTSATSLGDGDIENLVLEFVVTEGRMRALNLIVVMQRAGSNLGQGALRTFRDAVR